MVPSKVGVEPVAEVTTPDQRLHAALLSVII